MRVERGHACFNPIFDVVGFRFEAEACIACATPFLGLSLHGAAASHELPVGRETLVEIVGGENRAAQFAIAFSPHLVPIVGIQVRQSFEERILRVGVAEEVAIVVGGIATISQRDAVEAIRNDLTIPHDAFVAGFNPVGAGVDLAAFDGVSIIYRERGARIKRLATL